MIHQSIAKRLLGGLQGARARAKPLLGRVALAAAGAVALSAPVLAADAPIRWRMAMGFPTTVPGFGEQPRSFIDAVERSSGGTIEIKLFEPDKLVPAFGIFDAVKENKIPAGFTTMLYDQGKIPAAPLFASVPFGLDPIEYFTWVFEGGGFQLAREIYGKHGIVATPCGLTGAETAGWYRKEINSVDDIKGLRLRYAGVGGKVMQKLGASITVLPGGEVYQALERGTIDGAEFSQPSVDLALGFNRIAKTNYLPGWHQTTSAFHLLVNAGVWNKLSETQRGLIETACTASLVRGLAASEILQANALAKYKELGVSANAIPDNVLKALKTATDQVMEEESAADADFKKVYDSQRTFMQNYKEWKVLGYLPRNF